jgi:hypothetical protein
VFTHEVPHKLGVAVEQHLLDAPLTAQTFPATQHALLQQVPEAQQTLLQQEAQQEPLQHVVCPVAHFVLHVPQLLLSVLMLSHVQVEPEAQQAWSEVQLVPQVPQFGLVLGVTQEPLHRILGGVQPIVLPLVLPPVLVVPPPPPPPVPVPVPVPPPPPVPVPVPPVPPPPVVPPVGGVRLLPATVMPCWTEELSSQPAAPAVQVWAIVGGRSVATGL